MIYAYIYSSCTSCRKTITALKESGTAFTSRDYFKDRFRREELAVILADAGLTPSDVLSKRSKVYGERQEEIDGCGDDVLLSLMVDEPTLLRRPIVIGTDQAVIGHNDAKLADLIARNRA